MRIPFDEGVEYDGRPVDGAALYAFKVGTANADVDPPTGTPISGKVWDAASGGNELVFPLLSTSGRVTCWFDRAQQIDIVVTNHSGGAHLASPPSSPVIFNPWKAQRVIAPSPTKLDVSANGAIGDGATDDGPAINTLIASLGTSGGWINFDGAAGTTYSIATPLLLPRALTRWLRFTADPGVTVKLAGTGRLFDFNKVADYDTFQWIRIEDLSIDANNVGGQNHVLIGTYQAGVTQTRINLKNIEVRRCRVYNVPVDPTTTTHRLGIYLVVSHPAGGETATVINDIVIEDNRIEGGNQGVVVGGSCGLGSAVTNLAVSWDRVAIRRNYHSLGAIQVNSFSSANYQVGSLAAGGVCWIEENYGQFSGDVGIEVNNYETAHVARNVIDDANTAAYYTTNFHTIADPEQQRLYWDSNTARLGTSTSGNGRGYSCLNSNGLPIGKLYLRQCSYFANGIAMAAGLQNALSIAAQFDSLVIRDLHVNYDGVTWGSVIATHVLRIVPATTAAFVSIRGVKIRVNGVNSSTLTLTGILLNGPFVLGLDDVQVEIAVTGMTSFGTRGMHIGQGVGSSGRGSIRRFLVKAMGDDANPRGIVIGTAANLAITQQLRIEDCDFSAMAGGVEILFENANDNKAKTFLYGIKFRTFPVLGSNVAVGASPFVYQNLDGYAEYVYISGGTVSAVDVAPDGATYTVLGLTSGAFYLDNGASIKITHTGAPTMKKVPVA